MDWTIKEVRDANHNPEVVVNGRSGKEPLTIDAVVGTPVLLDATGTRDPDGNSVDYTWFFYPEAGTGIPGLPVFASRVGRAPNLGEGGIPSEAAGGPPEPPARVEIQNARSARATVMPRAGGIAHVILQVVDTGSPALTSYRRIVIRITPSSKP